MPRRRANGLPARPPLGTRSARRGGAPHCTADLAMEQTMSPLLSALSRYVLPRGDRCGKLCVRASAGPRPRRLTLYVEPLERRHVLSAVAPPSGLVSWWTADNTAADLE